MKKLLLLALLLNAVLTHAQSPPWERPLRMAWSSDGKTFDPPTIFQDSSGVPCMIRWKGDTLICAFQWFRLPQNTPSWDRVAVKFSYDSGLTWTAPTPIVVNGLPANYQRPFDPTLTVFGGDSLRIYFSSSEGMPTGGLNEIVNCYSAKSHDGVHFTFEPIARVDHLSKPLIDPAVIYFNNGWHYTAPVGAPQEGAHHYVSPDGLNFSPVPSIPSDNQHNWTGNLMLRNETELRFYGSGPFIWYNASPNGGQWNGFVNTNVQGGDPSVVQVSANSFLMVFVGKPYASGTEDNDFPLIAAKVFPNPTSNTLHLFSAENLTEYEYAIFNPDGRMLKEGRTSVNYMSVEGLPNGFYFLKIRSGEKIGFFRFLKN
ncbi:MAG: T9SS type A sorting domain-containing protein [Phycisphaerae bacterium]|nr:T9SS type A sorting domain-containing protein [Saprospiraceae bacterium]